MFALLATILDTCFCLLNGTHESTTHSFCLTIFILALFTKVIINQLANLCESFDEMLTHRFMHYTSVLIISPQLEVRKQWKALI